MNYNNENRGLVQHRDLCKMNLFEGMRWGNATPTDIDGFIDFGNKLFVFIEIKCGETTEIPFGQRLALERVCEAASKGGVRSYIIHGYYVDKDIIDIDTKSCLVKSLYFYDKKLGWKWGTNIKTQTVMEAIEDLRTVHGIK